MSLELCFQTREYLIAGAQRDRLVALQQKVASPQEVSFVLLYCCVSCFVLIRLVWQSASRAQLPNMQDTTENKLHDPQDQVFLAHLPFNLTLTLSRTHYH